MAKYSDDVVAERSLEKQMVADATNMPALTGFLKPFVYFACFAVKLVFAPVGLDCKHTS